MRQMGRISLWMVASAFGGASSRPPLFRHPDFDTSAVCSAVFADANLYGFPENGPARHITQFNLSAMRPYAQDPEQFLIDSRGDLMGQEFGRGERVLSP